MEMARRPGTTLSRWKDVKINRYPDGYLVDIEGMLVVQAGATKVVNGTMPSGGKVSVATGRKSVAFGVLHDNGVMYLTNGAVTTF